MRAGGLHHRSIITAALAFGALAPTAARADDLRAALTAAYTTNPTLAAARDQQKATDEGVPIARADGLPSANGTAQETEFLKTDPLNTISPRRQLSLSGTVNVPLYSGGAVRNAVHAAETRVDAGKADLRGSESSVFNLVVTAYMDVLLGEATVRLNRAQVATLETDLRSTSDRFQIGDLTRTDVAQSQSRLALAKGRSLSAEASLAGARERYIQAVGRAPGDLAPPPPLPDVPATAEEAVAIALDGNPDLLAARQRSKAAHFDTNAAAASRLPKLGFFADGARSDYLGSLTVDPLLYPGVTSLPQAATTADIGLRATIPLYQGGRPSAQIRQAQAQESQALEQEIGAERAVIAAVRADYTSLTAAIAIIASSRTAVDAAGLSLEGVRAENSVGNRTVLDVLNAEQELVNAKLDLVTAERNAYVAHFALLAAMGRAEARDLGLGEDMNGGGPLYDPAIHYRQALRTYWDWSQDPRPKASATHTVDTPTQDGTLHGK